MRWKIPVAEPSIGEAEVEAVLDVVKSGWISQGRKVEEFEERFSKYCGSKYGVATNTGTAAIHLALEALGIIERDEVITSPLTCVATIDAIHYSKARPVLVDIDPLTMNISPEKIEEKICEKTKAIMPVHLFGHPVDMDPVMEIAERHNLLVIEDACQAAGSKYKNRMAGSLGKAGCFSFYINKTITTAEGGMVVTDDPELRDRMTSLRNFGSHQEKKFHHPFIGFNYKMSDIHAAIGIAQMNRINQFIRQRRRNAEYLTGVLSEIPDLVLPFEADYAYHSYFSYPIRTRDINRKSLVEFLKKEGIETRPIFSLIPRVPPFRKIYSYEETYYPEACRAYDSGFYISCSPTLSTENMNYIAKTVTEYARTQDSSPTVD